MSKDFYDMIYLFSCGARGKMPTLSHQIDVMAIYKHAKSQGVWETTLLALKRLYDAGEILIDKSIFDKWHRDIILTVSLYTRRTIFVNNTICTLEQNGIACCTLKGDAIAQLYHNPVCRLSTDTDILIDKTFEKKAGHILANIGYNVKMRCSTSHHLRAFHPIAGLIELHLSLHDELFEDVWFDNKANLSEAYTKITATEGNFITTLGINDGLIFTTLHFIKHFLSKGVGTKPLMDTLMYMSYYKSEIDWNRFNSLMTHLRYDKFIDNAIGIGIIYLGFDEKDFQACIYDDNIMQKILSDMEEGGAFGHDEVERADFFKIYNKARFYTFKKVEYEHYMKNWGKLNII